MKNGLVGLKILNKNKFLTDKIKIKKLSFFDNNTSILKHNETLHQNPYSSKPPKATTDKNSKDIVNNKLPDDLLKENLSKKGWTLIKTLSFLITIQLRLTGFISWGSL